ncbi:ABC transporter ATP-binding protein [Martelella alba]|uniref:ABC transporter ATP-binding protein n=1 Tax=Martelella alba TaxID=2590451 RepID=A0A506U8Q7_9HYPH|nr:ABC transporter ATP-binding protein [Martelella alba]TPW28247.1 ABC transporter ATP-binding protein [Martelella alba]
MKGAHIALDNISHRYRRSRGLAVSDVSLRIEASEAVALVGRSGCGKSTLLHIMSGMMRASSGSVHIDGLEVKDPSPKWVVMFQQPSLYPWMTVAENVALGLRFTGRRREIDTRVPELLKLVELNDFGSRNVQDLSGGQQQRVALARSLAPHPDILLLDEPFSALDAFTRASLQRDVRRIAKEMGITLVLVTHDLTEAAIMADRAVVLSANPGRLSEVVDIDLEDRSDLRSAEFSRLRSRLNAAYGRAAGGLSVADPDAVSLPATSENDDGDGKALPARVQ